ncbi:hypothetical protein ACUOCP_51070, partial [Escherichia sp. R-CC3]
KITCFVFGFCCFNVNFDHLVHFSLLAFISCNLLAAQAFSRTGYIILWLMHVLQALSGKKII